MDFSGFEILHLWIISIRWIHELRVGEDQQGIVEVVVDFHAQIHRAGELETERVALDLHLDAGG